MPKIFFIPKKALMLPFVLCVAVIGYTQDVAVFPQLGHSGTINSMAFSPDGKQIISAGDTIKLWDTANGREVRTFSGHTGDIKSICFNPDGKQILSGSDDYTIKLWDTETGKEIRTFSGHTSRVMAVCFSPDGKQILSGSRDETIKLWDMDTGQEVRTFNEDKGWVSSICFSPDGKQIFSGFFSGALILWDVISGEIIKAEDYHSGTVTSVMYSPDGRYMVSGSADKTFILWESINCNFIGFIEFTESVNSVSFSPDGKQILVSDRNSMNLFDAENGYVLKSFSGHNGIGTSIFSPDGNKILFNSGNNINILDIENEQIIQSFSSNNSPVMSVCLNSYGKQFLSSSRNGVIKLWDIERGHEIITFSGHTDLVWSICFSPDEKQVLSGSWDSTVRIWDIEGGNEIKQFSGYTETSGFISVIFSPDGKYFVSSVGFPGITTLWDVESGQKIRSFSGHTSSVYSMCFSSDGSQLLTSSDDNTIRLWDVESGQVIKVLENAGRAYKAYFCSNGKQLLSSSGNTIKLWDVESGQEIKTIFRQVVGFNNINTVTISPDGKFIVSGNSDGTIILWSVDSGQEIKEFLGHSSNVHSITFTPDSTRILSASDDGTTRLWDAATGKEIAQFISFSGKDDQLVSASRDITPVVEEAASSINGEWLVITPDGYYAASPRGDRYLNVRIGNTVTGIDSFRSVFYNPDVVRARLAGLPDPVSKKTVTIQQAAAFMPPDVVVQTQTRTAVSSSANISVSIIDKNLPVQNIIVMVNGRRLGKDELSAASGASGLQPGKASITVMGNQKTLNFTLPVNLDPGDNRIEVVAFNGYSENRRYVDVNWNAPVGNKPTLPNLYILAIGVNKYDNPGEQLGNLRNLDYCVADARGVIESLKAQEGIRYGKVHSLLIADDAEIQPTAENIRKNLSFLEGAGPKDVALLFLAGHGVSAAEGKFYFLPRDAVISGGTNVTPNRAISGDEIVAVLDAPGNRLVFIDACKSGGVDNDRMVRLFMDTNAFVFAACRGNESSLELANLGHGVFTYSVMDALKGATGARAADNVSVKSMSGFVSIDVPERTENRQHPSAYSLGFYDFPVAVIK